MWRIGFTKGLKPVGPRHWKRPQTLKRACFLFVKINAEHFDRSRFLTTTTVAPRGTATKATPAATEDEGHKSHGSKASIIVSNNYSNHKKTKSGVNRHRQRESNSENLSGGVLRKQPINDSKWSERDILRQRHRKRKHHVKLATANNASGVLQPKNLVRHHHDQGNGEGRRRQNQREQKERRIRLQNQRRQTLNDLYNSKPIPSVTNSASPTLAATTLAATASLAPSALNIVAMLAAGRRKRGRRKRQGESSDSSNISSNSGHQAMDFQLVAQSPLQAQKQYDLTQTTASIKGQLLLHEHNYYQQQKQQLQQKHIIAPVNSSKPSRIGNKIHQQNNKYSNSNEDSQLINGGSSHNSVRVRSRRRRLRIGKNYFNHNILGCSILHHFPL